MMALSTKLNLVQKLHLVSWSADQWDGSGRSKIPIGSLEMQEAKEDIQDEGRQKSICETPVISPSQIYTLCDTGSLMHQRVGLKASYKLICPPWIASHFSPRKIETTSSAS